MASPLPTSLQTLVSAIDLELSSLPVGVTGDGPRFHLNHTQLDILRNRMAQVIAAAAGTTLAPMAQCGEGGPVVRFGGTPHLPIATTTEISDDTVGDSSSANTADSTSVDVGVAVGASAGAMIVLIVAGVVTVRARRRRQPALAHGTAAKDHDAGSSATIANPLYEAEGQI